MQIMPIHAYKFKESYIAEIVRLAERGMPMVSISASWNLHRDTLGIWARTNKEFGKAYEVARTKFMAFVADQLIRGMNNPNFDAKGAQLVLRYLTGEDYVKPIDSQTGNKAVDEILGRTTQTVDQLLKSAQAYEIGVRATESADYMKRLEQIEEQLAAKNKTRVGR